MWRRLLILSLAGCLLPVGSAATQVRLTPRLEPVAETKLLMEGVNLPNFQALQRLLQQKPAEVEAWTISRGQALLIAENGNLLLIRPPRNAGQDMWMERASDLRAAATRLARSLGARDYERSRLGLVEVAKSCNSCHQSFRVPTRLTAFGERTVQLPPLDERHSPY